jgi:SAM-dependent methyltransferase
MFATYYAASTVADAARRRMHGLRGGMGIPGLNSVALNRAIWNAWDWGQGGEEWTSSPEWKGSVLRCVLERLIPQGGRILEIGPGGGRWTAALIERADEYVGLDLSETAVDTCRRRFRDERKATFIVGSGEDLQCIGGASIDAIWSFDVFVHINEVTVASYLDEFARVLKPGGIAVIHHGGVGGKSGGWRSDLTGERMHALIEERRLTTVDRFDSWFEDGRRYEVTGYGDIITVMRNDRTQHTPTAQSFATERSTDLAARCRP